MERIGAEYDIHLVWNIKELINKVGPEKAIRELKKRCEAGAIIGCTLYKRQIEHWLQVAMRFEDKAGRGPAEEFMAAAGEDVWVGRVEKLHEEYPDGIPRSKQLDLIDEFNTELERKVGRRIPLEPGDASEEDIKESKKVAGQMARHEKITPPKPEPEVKKEKEIPPQPPKEKEALKPEPIRAPAEPIIPVPEPGRKAPELDLMKREIEERIARMRAEKARGELKAGEKITELPYEERRKLAKQIAATFPESKGEAGKKLTIDDISFLSKEKRIELAKKIASGEIEIREDTDILTEPKDYSQWTFGDFEGLLPGLESVEDLEELYEQVGASEVIADSDKETLRNLIRTRIDEVKRFYTEWATKGV